MNMETGKKYKSTFIPCGDALEKMDLFAENVPEKAEDNECIRETEKAVLKNSD